MKQVEKLKQYKNYFILFTCIILLFVVLQLINNTNIMYVDYLSDRVKADDNLIKQNDEYYLSYKYVKNNIDSEIYYDKISKKVVISSEYGLFKVKINDKNINVNFENRILNNEGIIERENKYISLEVIKQAYNVDSTVCNNTIYLYNNNKCDAKVKYNNVSVYKGNKLNSNIAQYVDKKDKINILFEKEDFVFAKINDKEVGYILKNRLKYKNSKVEEKEEGSLSNSVYFFADSNSKYFTTNLNIDGVFVDMFSVTKLTSEINEKNINVELLNNVKEKNINVYGIINNGYDLAGFNTATTSQILSDEAKRINTINNLNEKIEKYNLDGVVIDFRKLKEKDIENYIQFIKELKAFTQKNIIVNVNADEYKLYIPVVNYTDFSILNVYGQRDLKSTVPGSVSDINWMKEIINNCLEKANSKKIIIGMPAYSILWTEKNSNIVDSEVYNLKAMQNYIEKNKLELKNINGQNYTELKKGSLTYRLWVEDEFSIKNRLEIIKEKEVKGIAIYKLGYENDRLIDVLKNNY